MDIPLVLSSISAATSAAKELLKLQEVINSAEARLKIADIQTSLADSKTALSSAKEKILELEKQVKELTTQKQNIERLEFRDGLYFDPQHGDYKCPTCIENHQKIITLQKTKKRKQ